MKPVFMSMEPRRGSRMIVVSDVHGNLPFFLELMDKVALTPADELILLGDMVEKGRDSLATLRYIMKLGRTHRVHMVCGNCDGWHPEIDEPTPRTDEFLIRYMNSAMGDHGLLAQMCAEAGFPVSKDMDAEALRGMLRERFVPELDFLRSLPTVLETPEYTFVHGGIPEGEPEGLEAWWFMKNDYYARAPRRLGKWQIVGHTPVVLYRQDITDANPIIDRENKLISIDGGCVLKDDGQLNALLIPPGGGDQFFSAYYDPFPVRRVKDAQEASPVSIYIRWGDNEVQVLERGAEFSRCRHTRTGYECDILTEDLFGDEEFVHCNDCTDYRLPLAPGDTVSVVRETSRGYQIKKDGISGWYYGELL